MDGDKKMVQSTLELRMTKNRTVQWSLSSHFQGTWHCQHDYDVIVNDYSAVSS